MKAIPRAPSPLGGAAVWSWGSSFSSENGFYIWAGETPYWGTPSPEPLWKFTSDNNGSGIWESETPTYDLSSEIVRVAKGATAQTPDAVFILGGMTSSYIDPDYPEVADDKNQHVPGMLSYNTTTKEWRNISTVAFTPPSGTFLDGDLQYVPGFGTNGEGILVPLGGWIPSIEPAHSYEGYYFLPFSNIAVFDIATSQWHWQCATGTIPKPRRRGCSVGVREDGAQSYELFLFGGYNDNDNTTLGDVHVLSLPSFTWSKAEASTIPRTGHACAVGENNRLMVSVGAGGPGGIPNGWQYRDPWPQGIGVLDLTEMTWASEYNPDVGRYKRPKVVDELYKEGAITRMPTKWSSEGVKKFFMREDYEITPSTYSNTPPIGVIAGAIAGSVVFTLLLISLAFYVVRRRRKTITRLSPPESLITESAGSKGDGKTSKDTKHELPIGDEKWEMPEGDEKHEMAAVGHTVYDMPISTPAVELPCMKMDGDDMDAVDQMMYDIERRRPGIRAEAGEADEKYSPRFGGVVSPMSDL